MNQPLHEMQVIKNFLSGILKPNTKVQAMDQSPKGILNQATSIVSAILKAYKITVKKIERKPTPSGILLRYHIDTLPKKYVLKAYLIYETHYFNMTLWSEDSQDYLDAITVGDVRQTFKLRAIGKQRIKRWAKNGG